MSLSQEQISALLDKEPPQRGGKVTQKTYTPHPGVRTIGPVNYSSKENRCASKGCGCPTYLMVSGISYCTVHALDVLNLMLVGEDKVKDCICKTGHYSRRRLHSSECPVYERLKG